MSALFGPAGSSEDFHSKHKFSWEMPGYLADMGLNAFEYQCGQGVRVNDKTAQRLKEESNRLGIRLSLHSPYFISLSSVEEQKRDKSIEYILQSCDAAMRMGADRIVIHSGPCSKMTREEALALAKDTLLRARARAVSEGYESIHFCPETMGKINQVGDLQETLEFCTVSDKLMPCIDFGHLYARSLGADEGEEATCRILDAIVAALGEERGKQFHVHFSNIEYTKAGEKRHHNYGDSEYGPSFEPLAKQIVLRNLDLTIICESKGRMAEDAALFMSMWNKEKNR